MSKIKAIFSDIDGTLLNSKHQITNETKKTIQKVVASGVPFVLVSARMPDSIIDLQQKLDVKSPIICYSGALVLGATENRGQRVVINSVTLPRTETGEIYSLVNKLYSTISFNLYSHNHWVVNNSNNHWVIQEEEITNVTPLQVQIDSYISNNDIHKILCMGSPEEIKRLEEKLIDKYSHLTIYKSKDTYLEVMADNASKSNAIQKLEKLFGITRQEVMAIGDNFNDIDMLTYAGLGVAMGNAPVEVQQAADTVTLTNDEDGLKESIRKYFFAS